MDANLILAITGLVRLLVDIGFSAAEASQMLGALTPEQLSEAMKRADDAHALIQGTD